MATIETTKGDVDIKKLIWAKNRSKIDGDRGGWRAYFEVSRPSDGHTGIWRWDFKYDHDYVKQDTIKANNDDFGVIANSSDGLCSYYTTVEDKEDIKEPDGCVHLVAKFI